MGWNDREPHFTNIERYMDEHDVDYETALERYVESMLTGDWHE